jgi:hypothetical protein
MRGLDENERQRKSKLMACIAAFHTEADHFSVSSLT